MGRRKNSKDVNPKIGENGAALTDDRKKQLAGYIGEVERHEAEVAEIRADIKTIYESAKDAGFHTKAMRHIVKERKVEKDKREAFEAVVDVYKHALGMLSDLPLGLAATLSAASVAADKAGRRKPRQMHIAERADLPPTSDIPHGETSDRPFGIPEEE